MFKKFIVLCALFCFSLSAAANKTVFLPDERGMLVEQKEVKEKNIFENKDLLDNGDQNIAPTPEYKHTFMKMMFSLLAIVFLGFITIWMFRKISKSRIEAINNLRSIKILEKRVLSPKSMLYLVEFEGQKLLISESHLEVRVTKLD
jgi:flagellar protein FliO/FliZ